MNTKELSKEFRIFAEDCRDSSPLYEALSISIAEEKELLELCLYKKKSQPAPNMLFGAVQYLLLRGANHPLANFYPSVSKDPKNNENAFPYFKDFCRQHTQQIISLLQVKLVQTNEIRRCTYLYPIFCLIYEKVQQPLHMMEIGSSAGLQLLWDQFSYSYGTGDIYGNPHSNILLTSEYIGGNPPFHKSSPPVASKIGVDLHPNDVRYAEDRWWLDALIWPEHHERRKDFKAAASYFQENPVELIKGNAIEHFTELTNKFPKKSPICIFHTHVANQIPKHDKYELVNQVKLLGQEHEVFHIYNNMWDNQLHLDYIHKGIQLHYTVGHTNPHGKWFEWKLPNGL